MGVEGACRKAGIPEARLTAGPRLWCGPVYTARPSSAAEHGAWLERLAAEASVIAVSCPEPFDWLDHRDPPDELEVRRTLAEADRLLAQLDRWQPRRPSAEAPDPLAAVRTWAATHPDGAPLSSLVAALGEAPKRPVTAPTRAVPTDRGDTSLPARADLVAVVASDLDPPALLAAIGFGAFNACPPAAVHVAAARRWARDHDARLVALGGASYAFRVGCPPRTEQEHLRLLDEQDALGADERPPQGALRRLATWRFWWD